VADAVYESLRTRQTVTFGSLSTAFAGVYTCEGSLSSPALTSPYQTTTSYTIGISGRLQCTSMSRYCSLLVSSSL
jgi:hypothetical protein